MRSWALVAAIALFAGAGCGGDDNGSNPRVAVVGDSTTRLMETQLDEELADAYDLDVRHEDGRRIDEMLPTLERQLSGTNGSPDIVVVNLGTNDAVQGYDGWRVSFDEMMRLLQNSPCVLFVTVAESTDAYGKDGTAQAINRAIRAAADADDNIHIVDWNAVVEERGFEVSLEGIHENEVGARVIAEMIRDTLEDCPED